MPLKALAGKCFLVTAGANGIGRATVRRLVAEGARVAVMDIAEEPTKSLAAKFGEHSVLGMVADVSDTRSFDRCFERTLDRFGRLDGLMNNAGVVPPHRVRIVDAEYAGFQRILDVNVLGTFHGLQTMLRRAERDGVAGLTVVNTSSGLALRGAPHHGQYAASESAIISLTRTAAIEGAPFGIRVNAVLPGQTATAALLNPPPDRMEEYVSAVPWGPDEVAAAAVWLLSEESVFVTGVCIQVDGGQTA